MLWKLRGREKRSSRKAQKSLESPVQKLFRSPSSRYAEGRDNVASFSSMRAHYLTLCYKGENQRLNICDCWGYPASLFLDIVAALALLLYE